jgi:hypothetical protein
MTLLSNEKAMKLVRMSDEKVGLLVLLPGGLHVIDIASSLGVFVPHDPLSNGLLNGALKDGCNWSLIVKCWAHLRSPLKKLANVATVTPDHPCLVMQPFTEQLQIKDAIDQIAALDITDTEERDPTGRRTMARQFSELPENKIQRDAPSAAGAAQVIDFSQHKPNGDA